MWVGGELQTTTIRALHAGLQPLAQGAMLTLDSSLPSVQAGSELPLAKLARQLAALYTRLEILLSATG